MLASKWGVIRVFPKPLPFALKNSSQHLLVEDTVDLDFYRRISSHIRWEGIINIGRFLLKRAAATPLNMQIVIVAMIDKLFIVFFLFLIL